MKAHAGTDESLTVYKPVQPKPINRQRDQSKNITDL